MECSFDEKEPIDKRVVELLDVFLGVSANPGLAAYRRWLSYIEQEASKIRSPGRESSSIKLLSDSDTTHYIYSYKEEQWLTRTAIFLGSDPVNPLFALCLFKFGKGTTSPWQFAESSVDSCNKHGYSLILVAAASGNMSAIDVLLNKEADVNPFTTSLSGKPLVAAIVNGHMEIAERLVGAGALKSTHYSSILEAVARIGDAKAVRWLLSRESNSVLGANNVPHDNHLGGSNVAPKADTSLMVTEAVMIAALRNDLWGWRSFVYFSSTLPST